MFFLQKGILVALYSDRLGPSSAFSHGLASAALLYCRPMKATVETRSYSKLGSEWNQSSLGQRGSLAENCGRIRAWLLMRFLTLEWGFKSLNAPANMHRLVTRVSRLIGALMLKYFFLTKYLLLQRILASRKPWARSLTTLLALVLLTAMH